MTSFVANKKQTEEVVSAVKRLPPVEEEEKEEEEVPLTKMVRGTTGSFSKRPIVDRSPTCQSTIPTGVIIKDKMP